MGGTFSSLWIVYKLYMISFSLVFISVPQNSDPTVENHCSSVLYTQPYISQFLSIVMLMIKLLYERTIWIKYKGNSWAIWYFQTDVHQAHPLDCAIHQVTTTIHCAAICHFLSMTCTICSFPRQMPPKVLFSPPYSSKKSRRK